MGDWESIFKKSGKVFSEIQEDIAGVAKLLKKSKAKKILDLGCGSGRHTAFLAKSGFDVYATDVAKTGLKLTQQCLKKEGLKATVRQESCYSQFSFPDNFFDAVISTQVIHHNFHDKIKFCISEIERVLKPGGIVYITVTATKYRRGATKFEMPEPHTYIMLDGEEKGVPHFIYTKSLMKKDFKNFLILKLHKDKGNHWCLLGKLKEIAT